MEQRRSGEKGKTWKKRNKKQATEKKEHNTALNNQPEWASRANADEMHPFKGMPLQQAAAAAVSGDPPAHARAAIAERTRCTPASVASLTD